MCYKSYPYSLCKNTYHFKHVDIIVHKNDMLLWNSALITVIIYSKSRGLDVEFHVFAFNCLGLVLYCVVVCLLMKPSKFIS